MRSFLISACTVNRTCQNNTLLLQLIIIRNSLQDASDIRNEADDTKDKASTLRNEADRLSGDVDDAETRLEEYERQAVEDERLTKEVSEIDGMLCSQLLKSL